jgi:hypothetical protein
MFERHSLKNGRVFCNRSNTSAIKTFELIKTDNSTDHQDSTHLRDVRINASARLLSPTAISQKYLDSNGSKNFSF